MTEVIQEEKINECYVYIDQDKYSMAYKVGSSKTFDGSRYYVINERTYPTLLKAKRRYNYLKSKIKKESKL